MDICGKEKKREKKLLFPKLISNIFQESIGLSVSDTLAMMSDSSSLISRKRAAAPVHIAHIILNRHMNEAHVLRCTKSCQDSTPPPLLPPPSPTGFYVERAVIYTCLLSYNYTVHVKTHTHTVRAGVLLGFISAIDHMMKGNQPPPPRMTVWLFARAA